MVRPAPTFKRSLLAGFLAGIASGITGNLLAAAISSVTDKHFPELSPLWIGFTAMFVNLAGGVFFYALARWTTRPRYHFVLVALSLAILDSVLVWVRMPPGFGVIAAPTHFLVALIAIVMVPKLALATRQSRLSEA